MYYDRKWKIVSVRFRNESFCRRIKVVSRFLCGPKRKTKSLACIKIVSSFGYQFGCESVQSTITCHHALKWRTSKLKWNRKGRERKQNELDPAHMHIDYIECMCVCFRDSSENENANEYWYYLSCPKNMVNLSFQNREYYEIKHFFSCRLVVLSLTLPQNSMPIHMYYIQWLWSYTCFCGLQKLLSANFMMSDSVTYVL